MMYLTLGMLVFAAAMIISNMELLRHERMRILQGRCGAAISFWKKQKEETGEEAVFVPLGFWQTEKGRRASFW